MRGYLKRYTKPYAIYASHSLHANAYDHGDIAFPWEDLR